jgi:lipid-A-disaccharide synthase
MLDAAGILKAHNPNIQFLLSQASSIEFDDIKPYVQSSSIRIQVVTEDNYSVMQACDAIISASGTATLEIALTETPLIIIYKMSWLEYKIAKLIVKIPNVGLCNILANKKIVPELLQDEATPENIARETEKILNDQNYRGIMISDLKNIRKLLESSQQKDLAAVVTELL